MNRMKALTPLALAFFAASVCGCGHAPDPIAFQNRVFYHYDDPNSAADISAFEQRYPPLDLAAQTPNPEYIGVSVIGANIHLSRPRNWVLRTASNKAQERFVEYVSPNEYLFSIYERVDSPEDLWREVMGRYEDQVKQDGAELLGARVPVATWNAQGRAYVVRRQVKAAKAPYISVSREYLARSDHRIVLVQVVHQTSSLRPVSDELLRVMETLEIN
jgi:hypothetical protein